MSFTREQRALLAKYLLNLAQYYGKEITQEQIVNHLNVYQEFTEPLELIIAALDAYMKDFKNKTYPAPFQIKQLMAPELDEKDVAIKLTRDIIKAIVKHQHSWTTGYWKPEGNYWVRGEKIFASFEEAALDELGTLGLAVIQRYGWQRLCDNFFESDESIFSAQLREYILSSTKLAKQGSLDEKFQLPESQKPLAQLFEKLDMNKALSNNSERAKELAQNYMKQHGK